MNIRRLGSSQQLITQPAHAALAARIMQQWQPSHFSDSPRKSSILNAVDSSRGRIRATPRPHADPYAAALVSQHRLHVYRRHTEQLDWLGFFAGVTVARDAYLRASDLPRRTTPGRFSRPPQW